MAQSPLSESRYHCWLTHTHVHAHICSNTLTRSAAKSKGHYSSMPGDITLTRLCVCKCVYVCMCVNVYMSVCVCAGRFPYVSVSVR